MERRFFRQRSGDHRWVESLPDRFSMDDLIAEVESSDLRRALSWLYDAIEGGRVEPVNVATELRYAFVGARRSDDRRTATNDAVRG